jgi:hypothetical protein
MATLPEEIAPTTMPRERGVMLLEMEKHLSPIELGGSFTCEVCAKDKRAATKNNAKQNKEQWNC